MIIALKITSSVTKRNSNYEFTADCLTQIKIPEWKEPRIYYTVGKRSLMGLSYFQATVSNKNLRDKGDMIICKLASNGSIRYISEARQKQYIHDNAELFI